MTVSKQDAMRPVVWLYVATTIEKFFVTADATSSLSFIFVLGQLHTENHAAIVWQVIIINCIS